MYFDGELWQTWDNEDICKEDIGYEGLVLCIACRVALDPEAKGHIVKRGGKYCCGKCGAELPDDEGDLDGYDIEEKS